MSDCSPANRERELVLDRGETLRFRRGSVVGPSDHEGISGFMFLDFSVDMYCHLLKKRWFVVLFLL